MSGKHMGNFRAVNSYSPPHGGDDDDDDDDSSASYCTPQPHLHDIPEIFSSGNEGM
jgi:hypothetical protein